MSRDMHNFRAIKLAWRWILCKLTIILVSINLLDLSRGDADQEKIVRSIIRTIPFISNYSGFPEQFQQMLPK